MTNPITVETLGSYLEMLFANSLGFILLGPYMSALKFVPIHLVDIGKKRDETQVNVQESH